VTASRQIHSSSEEIVLILSGRAEAIIGDERGERSAGGIGLVPALVPQDVRNIGEETVRMVGCFSSGIVVSVFDGPLMPAVKRVVGRPSHRSRSSCRQSPRTDKPPRQRTKPSGGPNGSPPRHHRTR
jgi:Cupin domain